jgi:hypothetical protein
MFKSDPEYIVAGEIIRTARMYASSVSPLSKEILETLSGCSYAGDIFKKLRPGKAKEMPQIEKKGAHVSGLTNEILIGNESFDIVRLKGKKRLVKMPWEKLRRVKDNAEDILYKGLKGTIIIEGKYTLFDGEKLFTILRLIKTMDIDGALSRTENKRTYNSAKGLLDLVDALSTLLKPAVWKEGRTELGFLCLSTNGNGLYRIRVNKGFHAALGESLSSLETLIDDIGELGGNIDWDIKDKVNRSYRTLSNYLN